MSQRDTADAGLTLDADTQAAIQRLRTALDAHADLSDGDDELFAADIATLIDAHAALVERERALETVERLLFAWWATECNITALMDDPKSECAVSALAAWQVALQALRDWCVTRMYAALIAASHEETSHD